VKKFIFIILISLNQNTWAGGDFVGNGGVIWACTDKNSSSLINGILTDLFEAKEQFGWPLITSDETDIFKIYSDRKDWLKNNLPELFRSLESKFQYVESHLVYVNAELLPTNDYNNAIKPLASTCLFGNWNAVNIANFREEDQRVLINNELWNSSKISNLNKAALLFHESVYYWMRTYFGSNNSDKARKITGLLFSNLTINDIRSELQKIIGYSMPQADENFLCTMKNTKRNQIYIAFSNSSQSASINVRLRCQDDPDQNWCTKSTMVCDQIMTQQKKECVSENASLGRIYIGKGRNNLEAQFNAHMSCFFGTLALKGNPQDCPDFDFMECN